MIRLYFVLAWCFYCINAGAQSGYDTHASRRDFPIVCGHRGGFYENFPENSLSAFDFTFNNCGRIPIMLEFDLRKSKDGTLFVMHDETINRTTNGDGKISESSDVYLKSLFLKNANGELTNQIIPTFDSLLIYSQNRNIILMIDVKADVWNETINKLIQKNMIYKSILLTFTPEDTKMVYDLSSDIRISCLISNENDWHAIKELAIPTKNLIAYINKSTPQKLMGQFKNSLMMIMTDVSESAMNHVSPLNNKFYRKFIKKRKIDILITDFPVDVSNKIR